MRKAHVTIPERGGKRLTRRASLAGLVTALAMALVALTNPAAASADSCDGTYLIAGQSGRGGNPIFEPTLHTRNFPNPAGEITIPTSGDFRYLATAGTIRPNGFAVYSLFRDTPTGQVLVAQIRKTAGSNGVIRQEPDTRDVDVFANPGDRLRLQGFWETNAFCTPSRALDATLGWINFV